jgi:AbrB family looped-hinge helix DNA binding protein
MTQARHGDDVSNERETDWIRLTVEKDGRICINKAIRDYYGIKPGDAVDVKVKFIDRAKKEGAETP